jgi:pre-mRNA branch site protein p14
VSFSFFVSARRSRPLVRSPSPFLHTHKSCPLKTLFNHHRNNSGSTKDTRGTAYVVFEDIHDARSAHSHLQSFNVQGRYLLVAYHSAVRLQKKLSMREQEEALREIQLRHGVDGEQHPSGEGGGGGGAGATAAAAGGGG